MPTGLVRSSTDDEAAQQPCSCKRQQHVRDEHHRQRQRECAQGHPYGHRDGAARVRGETQARMPAAMAQRESDYLQRKSSRQQAGDRRREQLEGKEQHRAKRKSRCAARAAPVGESEMSAFIEHRAGDRARERQYAERQQRRERMTEMRFFRIGVTLDDAYAFTGGVSHPVHLAGVARRSRQGFSRTCTQCPVSLPRVSGVRMDA
jgi:hypothetical protein